MNRAAIIAVVVVGGLFVIDALLKQTVSEKVQAGILKKVKRTKATEDAARAAGQAFVESLGTSGVVRIVAGELGL